jgi:hypothetical protein
MEAFHTEIDFKQLTPKGQEVNGDVFLSRQLKEEGRTILVLSDGLGHGIRANIPATLTASMAVNYSSFHTEPEVAAQIIMEALPSNAEQPSYATFTIIEINRNLHVRVVNYDNPPVIILRGDVLYRPSKIYELQIEGDNNKGKRLRCQEFQARKEDRLIFFTDGVSQSGTGQPNMPMGWLHENVQKYAIQHIKNQPQISASKLAKKIVNKALQNDRYKLKDDTSCGVIYIRQPREMMLITGPPFYKMKDQSFIERIQKFEGKRIICGGTTAEIVARELNLPLKMEQHIDPSFPPISTLEGFELVTEGILTLTKIESLLENYNPDIHEFGNTPAQIVKLLLQHDVIHFMVGTRINWSHHDPDQPIEIEIRKTVVKRIIKLLETKFFKKVYLELV